MSKVSARSNVFIVVVVGTLKSILVALFGLFGLSSLTFLCVELFFGGALLPLSGVLVP